MHKYNVITKQKDNHSPFYWPVVGVGYSLAGLEPLGHWASEESVCGYD